VDQAVLLHALFSTRFNRSL